MDVDDAKSITGKTVIKCYIPVISKYSMVKGAFSSSFAENSVVGVL